MGFVYLQKTCSAEETIEAKRAFEFRTVLQDKWNATWLSSTGFITQPSYRRSHDEDITTPEKHRKSTERQPVPNGEIRDHPGKRQMVAVTAKEPPRHQMSLAPKRQRPANPASHLLSATVADEQPVAPEKAPNPKVIPLTTTQSGRMVKPVPRLIDLMKSELGSIRKTHRDIEGELLSFATLTSESTKECNPLLAYKVVNPDILRLHEAMKAHDKNGIQDGDGERSQ